MARDELFLVSKVWNSTIHRGPEAVQAQVRQTLRDLGTSYIDLYLVHWPVPGYHVAAYKALQELVGTGEVRSIGLSNYTIDDYQACVTARTPRLLALVPHVLLACGHVSGRQTAATASCAVRRDERSLSLAAPGRN